MRQVTEFAGVLARLARLDARGKAVMPGGVTVGMVRAPGGDEGRRASSPSRYRVVLVEAGHHGMSLNRAEVVPFAQPG